MTTESNGKEKGSQPERRKSDKLRRRLVDLTRMAGTDRREKKGRRKTDLDPSTERPSKEKDED